MRQLFQIWCWKNSDPPRPLIGIYSQEKPRIFDAFPNFKLVNTFLHVWSLAHPPMIYFIDINENDAN